MRHFLKIPAVRSQNIFQAICRRSWLAFPDTNNRSLKGCSVFVERIFRKIYDGFQIVFRRDFAQKQASLSSFRQSVASQKRDQPTAFFQSGECRSDVAKTEIGIIGFGSPAARRKRRVHQNGVRLDFLRQQLVQKFRVYTGGFITLQFE